MAAFFLRDSLLYAGYVKKLLKMEIIKIFE